MNDNPRKNGSGCNDPTAYEAIKNIEGKPRKQRDKDVSDFIIIVKRLAEITDFEISGRIVLIDKRTGRRYE